MNGDLIPLSLFQRWRVPSILGIIGLLACLIQLSKIINNVLALRVKKILGSIVSKYQNAFVKERQILIVV